MSYVIQVLKEQFMNIHMIIRLAKYDIRSKYGMHYLGAFWQFLNPIIQISIYWFVFGIGIRGGAPVDGIPFFLWLISGLIPWFFIAPSIVQASNSVYAKVNLVSKMKFPISVLPTITIMSNLVHFSVLIVFLIVLFYVNGLSIGIYWLQLPYYLIATLVFLFGSSLLFSTISILARDFQLVLQSGVRMLMYLTPILWHIDRMPARLINILKLNPLYYLIDGYRNTFLGKAWFFQDVNYTLYFWSLTIFILFIGSYIHCKFRNKFVDYL